MESTQQQQLLGKWRHMLLHFRSIVCNLCTYHFLSSDLLVALEGLPRIPHTGIATSGTQKGVRVRQWWVASEQDRLARAESE